MDALKQLKLAKNGYIIMQAPSDKLRSSYSV